MNQHWISGIFAAFFLLVFEAGAQVKMEYRFGNPKVVHYQVKVIDLTESNTGQLFDRDFSLVTSDHDFVKLKINDDYELNIFDNVKIDFVLIKDDPSSKKKPHVYRMNLRQGQVFFKRIKNFQTQHVVPEDLRFETDFFQWDLVDKRKTNIEMMISFTPGVPNIRFCNGVDTYSVQLFDHEKVVDLKPNRQATFTGQLEAGRVSYDILLQSKKVPKGKWSPIESCDFKELEEKESEFRLLQEKRRKEFQDYQLQAQQIKKENDSKYLCHVPYGQFNDCYWRFEDKICVRYRCNAEGKWASRAELLRAENHYCESEIISVAGQKERVRSCGY